MAKPLRARLLSLPTPCNHPIALRPLTALVPKPAIHHLPLLSPPSPSTSSSHRHFSRHAPSSNFALWPRKEPAKYYTGEPPHSYNVEEVKEIVDNPIKERIIIDVREPHELADTGRIPGAVNMPLNSHPNAIFVEPVTFYRTFGFLKPGTTRAQAVPKTNKNNTDPAAAVPPEGPVGGPVGGAVEEEKEEDKEEEQRVNEVVFYCKSGVRSKLAAQMAMNEIGWVPAVQSGDLTGGWIEWQAKGGKVEKVG